MGNHSSDKGAPSTGNGRTSSKTPKAKQVTVRTSGGSIMWKATAALFRRPKGHKR